jgi:pyruvate kinase
MLLKMIDAGMNVQESICRTAHTTSLKSFLQTIKEAIRESGKNVSILLDTKGPEVRVGTFKDGGAKLEEGKIFTAQECEQGDENGVALSFPKLVDLFYADGARQSAESFCLTTVLFLLWSRRLKRTESSDTVKKGGMLINRRALIFPVTTSICLM